MFDLDVREIDDGMEAELSRSHLAGGAPVISAIRLDVRVGEIRRGLSLSLSPEMGVAAAMAAIRRRSARAAVVVQNHRPIGVVTDGDILNACGDTNDLRVIPVRAVMSACDQPLCETDTVAGALRAMCARQQWHLPLVCARGLFLGALDIADISFWLRDRMTLMSVDAAFAGTGASS